MRTDIDKRREDIERWVSEGRTKTFICRELRCKQTTLNTAFKRLNIPEYKGNQGGKGKTSPHKKSAKEYLKSTHILSGRLRVKLIADGIKEHKCEKCSNIEWEKQPIPLELHHKDGNHYNNELDNLIILCPNCHSIEHQKE